MAEQQPYIMQATPEQQRIYSYFRRQDAMESHATDAGKRSHSAFRDVDKGGDLVHPIMSGAIYTCR